MGEDTGDVQNEDLSLAEGGAICVSGRRDDKQVCLFMETLTRPSPDAPAAGCSMWLYLSDDEACDLYEKLGRAIKFVWESDTHNPRDVAILGGDPSL